MIISLLILSCIIICLLTAIIYYRNKYWFYFDISDKAIIELDNKEKEVKIEFETLKNQLEENNKRFLSAKTSKIKNNYKSKYNTLAKKLELEYNNACEEIKSELFQQLEQVDNTLKDYIEDITMKNVLTFSCSCSKDLIPCVIDFTKENTFICPRCNSKYKVAINANPILVGREISDEQFSDLLERRLNEK